ncbi:hypothetical protein MCOR21_009399 [Pyricularia oryzae]|uniref:Uncharacterized protein n=1 Tax=Pyricularia oryzae TaxID=318829 RepID=A0A4P7NFR8_PYROR|nr:hypothetical protein MCOR19_008210 [Pyricularia oryzae]KAI6328794.1 hypothetical protein MCOR34_000061 [Pyricularia oryzae]KAI6421132.1 hypothetical protein MCOR21_009399 [Pyricularia oryzae]KAI6466556.1 hypothetical protein MCOR17_004779 [Pyricularia oryzae]KAI6483839.1 hypothetical protein MCOR18_004224 [Pyricularia oryzae]
MSELPTWKAPARLDQLNSGAGGEPHSLLDICESGEVPPRLAASGGMRTIHPESSFFGSAHHRARFSCSLWPERTLSGFTKFGKSDPSTAECGRQPQNFEFTPPNGFSDGLNSIECPSRRQRSAPT